MTTGIGTVATGMPFASPDEGSAMSIPSRAGVPQPIFEDLDILDVVAFQSPADEHALHRFGQVEPGSRTGGIQESNPAFMAPLHAIAAVMAG